MDDKAFEDLNHYFVGFIKTSKKGVVTTVKYSVVPRDCIAGKKVRYGQVDIIYNSKAYPAIIHAAADDRVYLESLRVDTEGESLGMATTIITRNKKKIKLSAKGGFNKELRNKENVDGKSTIKIQQQLRHLIQDTAHVTTPLAKPKTVPVKKSATSSTPKRNSAASEKTESHPKKLAALCDNSNSNSPTDSTRPSTSYSSPTNSSTMGADSQLRASVLCVSLPQASQGTAHSNESIPTLTTTSNVSAGAAVSSDKSRTVNIMVTEMEHSFIVNVLRNSQLPKVSQGTLDGFESMLNFFTILSRYQLCNSEAEDKEQVESSPSKELSADVLEDIAKNIGPKKGRVPLRDGSDVWISALDKASLTATCKAKPLELARRLFKNLLKPKHIARMSACGSRSHAPIPPRIYTAVKEYIKDVGPEDTVIPDAKFNACINTMCGNVRQSLGLVLKSPSNGKPTVKKGRKREPEGQVDPSKVLDKEGESISNEVDLAMETNIEKPKTGPEQRVPDESTEDIDMDCSEDDRDDEVSMCSYGSSLPTTPNLETAKKFTFDNSSVEKDPNIHSLSNVHTDQIATYQGHQSAIYQGNQFDSYHGDQTAYQGDQVNSYHSNQAYNYPNPGLIQTAAHVLMYGNH